MELNIELNIIDNQIFVSDLGSSYLEESDESIPLNRFRRSETKSLAFVSINKIDKEEEVFTHTFGNVLNVDKDGWLKVHYLVLPTKEWLLRVLQKPNAIGIYDIVYYISKNKVYWYQPSSEEFGEVTKLEEILDIAQLPNVKTSISIVSKDQVSICNLQKCYINLCQQIFQSRGFTQCWNKNNIESELIYKRDLVWMAMNVIKYMVECNQLYEAERIIELLHSCNGICSNKKVRNNDNGCGCS